MAGSASVREVYRAIHPLAVSVMERQQSYRVSYSLGDIHRLTFLSHEERTAVRNEWHAWHRQSSRLGPRGICLWTAGAAVALASWWLADVMSVGVEQTFGIAIPPVAFTAVALVSGIALIRWLPSLLAAIAAAALADTYVRGYSDGMTRGVNRALQITPEIEQEMWDELRQAERLDIELRQSRTAHHTS